MSRGSDCRSRSRHARRPRRKNGVPAFISATADYGKVGPCRVTALSMKHLTVDYRLGTAHVPMALIHEDDLAATKIGEWTELRILRWFLHKNGIPEKEAS